MVRVRIDAGRKDALFAQIAEQLRAQIDAGDLEPGERLPPAVDLAAALSVNQHTVLRAYGVLREEGLIELRRRRGAVVAAPIAARERLVERARAFLDEARRQGLTPREIQRLLQEVGR